MGRAIERLNSTPIIDPTGQVLGLSLEEMYTESLWNEEDYWDSVFEMEIAAALEQAGFSPSLVYEGEQVGPDVIIGDAGEDVWIECKRKRDQTPEESTSVIIREKIVDRVWRLLDIGHDGFGITIEADCRLRDSHVEQLSQKIKLLIESQNDSVSVNIDDCSFEIRLEDYFEGVRVEDPSLISTVPVDILSHIGMDVEMGDNLVHCDVQMKQTEEELRIANACIFDFRLSTDIDYVNWIMNTIKDARQKISGHPPAAVYLHVPYAKINRMAETETEDHRGKRVTQLERLEQRIGGLLNQSSSLNSVVITSRQLRRENTGIHLSRGVRSVDNCDPDRELTADLISFFNSGDYPVAH